MFIVVYIKIQKREAFLTSLLNEDNIVLIIEFAELALDSQTLRTFFDVSHHLCIDIERLREVDNLLGNFGTHVNLHAVTHIEHLVHLLPVGTGTLVDGMEQGRNREHVVLDYLAVVVDEVEHLGLRTTCTVNHTVNLGAQLVEQFLDDGCIGAGR